MKQQQKKSRYSVVESFVVYAKYVPGVERKGGKYPSPFRQESIPSFSIDGVSGRWYDFGMGIGGDVVSFIQSLHKIDFRKAIDIIGRDLDGYDPVDMIRYSGTLDSSVHKNRKRFKLTELSVNSYNAALNSGVNNKFLPMLIRRGISLDVLNRYKVGMSTYKNKVWLVIPFDYYNGFSWNYKRLRWGEKSKEIFTSGQASLYPRDTMLNDLPIVLCEGELDCLALISNGINAVSGTAGCATFKREWDNYFTGKDVVILYDYDDPGYNGSINIEARLKGRANSCRVVNWGEIVVKPFQGFDVSDYFYNGGSEVYLKNKLGLL